MALERPGEETEPGAANIYRGEEGGGLTKKLVRNREQSRKTRLGRKPQGNASAPGVVAGSSSLIKGPAGVMGMLTA